jgi:hypothetical protein
LDRQEEAPLALVTQELSGLLAEQAPFLLSLAGKKLSEQSRYALFLNRMRLKTFVQKSPDFIVVASEAGVQGEELVTFAGPGEADGDAAPAGDAGNGQGAKGSSFAKKAERTAGHPAEGGPASAGAKKGSKAAGKGKKGRGKPRKGGGKPKGKHKGGDTQPKGGQEM